MTNGLNRRALTAGVMAVAAAGGAPSRASSAVTVLTAHPATFALASALTAGTGIQIRAVQPPALPASRLFSFLSGRGAGGLAQAAATAEAVITIRSFWPEDPLYPHARRSNIRIVEIDAGRPLDGALPGIAIADPADASAFYVRLGLQPMPATGEGSAPWLAPTSLGRMADVLAADLERLAPAARTQIAGNLAALKRRLIAARARVDRTLAAAPSVVALALSPHFAYLASDLGLDLVASITAAPNEWTAERARMLSGLVRDSGAAVVLLDISPNADVARAISDAGAAPLVLATIRGETNDPVATVKANLAAIAKTFAKGPSP